MRSFRRTLMFSLGLAGLVAAQGFETSAGASTAERKFSIYANVGAGFSLGGFFVGASDEEVIRVGGRDIVESNDEYLNFGRGLKVDIGAAYLFLDHVGVRAAFNMSFGVPRTDIEWEERNETVSPVTTRTMTATFHNAQVGAKILLVPQFRALDLFDICVGTGLGIYWNSMSWEREYNAPGVHYEEEVEVDCMASLPFVAMLGIEVPVADRFILCGDLSYEAMNVTIESIKVKKSTYVATAPYAGVLTPAVGVESTKFEKDDGERLPPPKIPASNIAVRVGVRIPLF